MSLRRLLCQSLAALGLLAGAAAAAAADRPDFAPVLETNFPDPFVLLADGIFYAYATNSDRPERNVQLASSKNLADWALVKDASGQARDALPALPPWAKRGSTWAPEVLRTAAGYVLYFTAREKASGLQCIGTAVSADPAGPFASQASAPLLCQRDLGGTIDASPFRDADGKLYLYFKNDGNAARKPVQLWVQPLAPDGMALTGAATAVLRDRLAWEGGLIEAPTMIHAPAGYFLFFSANDFAWQPNQRLSQYSIGYAVCEGPAGPCKEAGDKPFLYSFSNPTGCLSGPGHQAVFRVGERWFMAFHAWSATPGCRPLDPARWLYVAPLLWKDGKPQVGVSLRPTAAGSR